MAINMTLSGAAPSPVLLIAFPTLTLLNLIMAVLLLKSVDVRQQTLQPAV